MPYEKKYYCLSSPGYIVHEQCMHIRCGAYAGVCGNSVHGIGYTGEYLRYHIGRIHLLGG